MSSFVLRVPLAVDFLGSGQSKDLYENIFNRGKNVGRIISIANQKGGVGKSTTAINLSACLGEKGKKVLLIDSDPQGNTTTGLGQEKNQIENTIYDIYIGNESIQQCIIKNIYENLDLIPANVNFSAAEIELIGIDNKEFILRNELDYIKNDYDFIIIDCPPSLSLLTVNAMAASDTIIVPIQCEYYALEGLSQLIHTVNLVKDRLNADLDLEGVVFTMYDSRTNLSQQVVDNVKENMPDNIFEVIIPRSIRLAEAPSYGQPITVYDAKSTGAESYRKLAELVIRKKR